MAEDHRKQHGAYYTPEDAVRSLVSWAVRRPSDRALDPSSGDGRFLTLHQRSVGIEQSPEAAAIARTRAPWALVHEAEFFAWAATTKERFECAIGNPPFIRYQRFSGEVRQTALKLCENHGATFSALTSSWAPFLVAAASLLKPGGRMAFVVPAEVGHAPYARPLLEYLFSNFGDIRLLAVRQKIFPDLSEDAWLLYADQFGAHTNDLLLAQQEAFSFLPEPPNNGVRVSLQEWRAGNYRLRPFLMGSAARELYARTLEDPATRRLGAIALVGIGYVTGANEFFHLRPSQVERIGVPRSLLQPTVRNGRALVGDAVTDATVKEWCRRDDPVLLLRLSADAELPHGVRRYLDTPEGREARTSYKCSNRSPWYVVPDVVIPDAFLSYMSGEGPALVANRAACTCTNSVHAVRLTDGVSLRELQAVWAHPFTSLSCEIEGHPLGGGMLKIEPREAQRIAIADHSRWQPDEIRIIKEGLGTLQSWRHYGGHQEAAAGLWT
jgi:adenine-specific DNA-methyltransferase